MLTALVAVIANLEGLMMAISANSTESARVCPASPQDETPQSALSLLVERARRGDENAWRSLVRDHTALLWWIARAHRLSDADAADAVQVTWLRCVQHLGRIKAPHMLPAWLTTTCQRECLRVIRGRGKDVPTDVSDPAGPFTHMPDLSTDADPAQPVLAGERAKILEEAIGRLPERHQQVLRQLMLSGHGTGQGDNAGYAEAAAVLGMPHGSLGPTRQRALRRLRRDERVAQLYWP
jgi:RNA polymerase sigma factor (sigma-70 family)